VQIVLDCLSVQLLKVFDLRCWFIRCIGLFPSIDDIFDGFGIIHNFLAVGMLGRREIEGGELDLT
jgi:hypothetical protein